MPAKMAMRDRLMSKVQITPNCWLWQSWTDRDGYGRFGGNGVTFLAHRVAYEEFVGPIPDGLCVCHHCDVRNCVRPDHLFLGTATDNNKDRDRKGRGNFTGPIVPATGNRHGSKTHPERVPRGERNNNAYLTQAQVDEIRLLRSQGWLQQDLADKFGSTQQTISKICSFQTWKPLKEST